MAEKKLNIIHFNDVYEIGARAKEPIGGCTRFATAVKQYKSLNPMLLFSGDLFHPSVLSTATKGKHMVPVMNALNVQASVIGNHEFDMGEAVLQKNLEGCHFPWLWSNVVDKNTGGLLFNSLRQHIIPWGGIKVGLVGLIEEEWFYATPKIEEYAKYLDFVSEGTKIAKELKDAGADIVICLAHMRIDECVRMAKETKGIDLILAGHDHFYELRKEQAIIVSGCDFRNLTVIKGAKTGDKWSFDFEKVDITASIAEDPEMVTIFKALSEDADKKLGKVIGTTSVPLDAINANVRTGETNLGNLLTDIMKREMDTEIAILQGGAIRSDDTYGPGDITLKMLLSFLPYQNAILKMRLTGKLLRAALEAGVSKYPSQEGRFPQVSGIQFEFDPEKPEGSRVLWVKVNGHPVEEARKYVCAIEGYIGRGNDGYDCLKEGVEIIVDEENAPILSTLVRRNFVAMKVLSAMNSALKSDARLALEKWSGRKERSFNIVVRLVQQQRFIVRLHNIVRWYHYPNKMAKYGITEELEQQYKENFALFDKNGDGSITLNECATVMKGLGYASNLADIKRMLAGADKDKNGKIEFGEFVKLMQRGEGDKKAKLQAVFQSFDTDKTGYLTRREIKLAMIHNGLGGDDAEVDRMFIKADANKDGKVDFEEFYKVAA